MEFCVLISFGSKVVKKRVARKSCVIYDCLPQLFPTGSSAALLRDFVANEMDDGNAVVLFKDGLEDPVSDNHTLCDNEQFRALYREPRHLGQHR